VVFSQNGCNCQVKLHALVVTPIDLGTKFTGNIAMKIALPLKEMTKSEYFHWTLAKRFPYAIYYTLADDLVSVHAVLDCRQDPKRIEERLLQERTRRWS